MGTMNLRKFAWSRKFLKPPETYKIDTITQIINAYPLRKYICVGDSGMIKY
jgi:phosphatidate phosphatase APP1